MAAFAGRASTWRRTASTCPGRYRGAVLDIEPDASSASYPLAMAAVAGGRVEVCGLHRHSLQGDAAFVDVLAGMGCTVGDGRTGLAVTRDPHVPLRGIEVDMAGISDLVPTLAVVAETASTPTTIGGSDSSARKESDRLGDLAAELAKPGARVPCRTTACTSTPPTCTAPSSTATTIIAWRWRSACWRRWLRASSSTIRMSSQELAGLLGGA